MYNLNHTLCYGRWRPKWLAFHGRHTWNLSLSGQCPTSLLCCCSVSRWGAALICIIWHSTPHDCIHARKKDKAPRPPFKGKHITPDDVPLGRSWSYNSSQFRGRIRTPALYSRQSHAQLKRLLLRKIIETRLLISSLLFSMNNSNIT